MKYKLLEYSSKGILIDRTPIMQDIRDTFCVSFSLPREGCYVAIFTGEDGVQYKKSIIESKVKFPHELLLKEQYVELLVFSIENERIVQTWECESIKVTSSLYMQKSQWQLSGGMTESNCYTRLVELEQLYDNILNKNIELEKQINSTNDKEEILKDTVEELRRELGEIRSVVYDPTL